MAEVSFSLAKLFEQAFGVRSGAFEPRINNVLGDKTPSRKTQSDIAAAPLYDVYLGVEYFLPITFKYTPDGETNEVTYRLPPAVISIRRRKKVIETELTERVGTVDEIVNIMDYEITVKGFIIEQDNELPEAQLVQLRDLCNVTSGVKMECALTDIYLLDKTRGSNDLVLIKEEEIPQVIGVKNVRPFVLSIKSTADFSLEEI